MRFGRAIALLFLVTGLWLGPEASAVEVGTARVNVIQELGEPASAIARGDTEVFTYRDGVKIKFQNGRVTAITGLKPVEPVAEAPAAEKAPTEAEEPKLTGEQAAELERLEKEAAAGEAKARAQLEKALDDLDKPPPAPVAAAAATVAGLLVGLGLKWALTIGALKLSCKYWNSEVPWTGILLVSSVDVVIRGVIEFVGYNVLHAMSLFYFDEAVSAFVMVPLLRKVSINQRLALAVEVVFTVKTFTIVVGSFLVTVALRALL